MKQSYLSSSSPVHNHFNHMKRILLALTLVGILAAGLAGFAQTNSPATDAAAAAASSPPAAEAPAPAAPQVAANDAAQPATPPAAPPAAEAADAPRLASVAQPNAVIPLIVMDDVPLTDAIRNLARQAGLNYMLDPKIGYGQMGADGKPTPQPSVSLRWENITAEQALTALLNNYTLQLLEDPKSKIARITTKDPAAPEPLFTKIIQLKFAGPTNIVANAQATLTDKRSRVMPDNRTSQLVVVATEKEIAAVDELVRQLDTQTKQVLIEARLLETVVNPTTSKGVDWSGTLAGQNVTFGNGLLNGTTPIPQTVQNISQGTTVSPGTPTTTTTTLPGGRTSTGTTTPASSVSSSSGSSSSSVMNYLLGTAANGAISMDTARGLNPATFFLNADGLKATLSFLNTYAETKVISSPRTVTLDNETSLIEVGTQYPIVNTTAGTANTTGGSQVTYSNLTVRLSVTPRISANNYVKLSVSPRIIRLGDQVASIVGGVANNVPSFETREITTSVMIPSGNTLVMGGLIQDNVHQQNTKVPVLGDIPGLGLLFRSDTKSRTKSNLIIFLTPTIVEDEDFQPTKSNFLKTKVPIKDSIEDDWSAWDSGKPKEWGKKVAPQEQSFDDAMAQPGTSSKTPTSK
jgi:type II secretory pathway component GspD/PulD (secretin)